MKNTALITGSGRGLGKELALVFAENNYDLILNGRNENNLKSVVDETSNYGADSSYILGDITVDGTIYKLAEEAKRKDISVLINNAGTPTEGSLLEDFNIMELTETLQTNLISPIDLTRRIYPMFKEKQNGTLIYLNSMIGLECKEEKGIGCAARWGLRGFVGSLRPEAEKNGINVISVYPTKIKTKLEYAFGYEPRDVAEEIFKKHAEGFSGMLELDGRPDEFKPDKEIIYG